MEPVTQIQQLWQMSYRGLLFGPDTGYEIVSIEGLTEAPTMRAQDVPNPVGDGEFANPARLDGRSITVEIDVTADTMEEHATLLQDLDRAFAPDDSEHVLAAWLPMWVPPQQDAIPYTGDDEELEGMGLAYRGIRGIPARVRRRSSPATLESVFFVSKVAVEFRCQFPLWQVVWSHPVPAEEITQPPGIEVTTGDVGEVDGKHALLARVKHIGTHPAGGQIILGAKVSPDDDFDLPDLADPQDVERAHVENVPGQSVGFQGIIQNPRPPGNHTAAGWWVNQQEAGLDAFLDPPATFRVVSGELYRDIYDAGGSPNSSRLEVLDPLEHSERISIRERWMVGWLGENHSNLGVPLDPQWEAAAVQLAAYAITDGEVWTSSDIPWPDLHARWQLLYSAAQQVWDPWVPPVGSEADPQVPMGIKLDVSSGRVSDRKNFAMLVRVTDHRGDPVSGATVQFFLDLDPTPWATLTTGSGGFVTADIADQSEDTLVRIIARQQLPAGQIISAAPEHDQFDDGDRHRFISLDPVELIDIVDVLSGEAPALRNPVLMDRATGRRVSILGTYPPEQQLVLDLWSRRLFLRTDNDPETDVDAYGRLQAVGWTPIPANGETEWFIYERRDWPTAHTEDSVEVGGDLGDIRILGVWA